MKIYIVASVKNDRMRHIIDSAKYLHEVRKGLQQKFPYAEIISPFNAIAEGLSGDELKRKRLEYIEECDTVYVCKNYKKSGFSGMEYGICKKSGKTIIMQKDINVVSQQPRPRKKKGIVVKSRLSKTA